jgi:hypothetical protein
VYSGEIEKKVMNAFEKEEEKQGSEAAYPLHGLPRRRDPASCV